MNNALMCFSDNHEKVEIAFKDYMNHYFSETMGKTDFIYDKTISFSEKEKKIDNLMLSEVSRLSGVDLYDKHISQEMYSSHPVLKWASMAVVNSLVDMIVPDVLNRSIGLYTETRYGNYGDSFSFEVEPNDLFYVSKAGRNQRTVEFQKQFVGQVTVVPENREISVSVNFYRVLCGKESLARFTMKAILSLEAQITKDVYIAFDTAMSALPTTPVDSKLNVTGWDKKEALRLAQTVTAFNNNSKAIFLGTASALSVILPDNANYRYWLDDEYATLGYVRNAFGYDTLVMEQIADWNNPYKLALKDDRIYIISPSSQKPIKLCYEGATRITTLTAYESADLTESTTINKSYGIGIATNAIAGIITLS